MKKIEREFRMKRPEFAALVNYIFPGSELDHIGGSTDSMERNGFKIHDTENWREHDGRTCRLWTERLHANRAAAEAELGAANTRIWLLYPAAAPSPSSAARPASSGWPSPSERAAPPACR